MGKQFIKKTMKLSLEFDSYVHNHPDIIAKIPNNACLFITVKGDKEFNRMSRSVVEKTKEKRQKYIEARKEGKRWILQPFTAN